MTTRLEIDLSDEEAAALDRFRAAHPRPYTPAQAARLLIRDQLIAMSDLPLPRANRSRWAGGRRRRGP